MKILSEKNYKKPLYAIGVTAALLAMTVTGCTDPEKGPALAGDVPCETTETTEEVVLDGDVAVCTPDPTEDTKETKETDDDIVELGGEIALEGGVAVDETEETK